MYKKLFANRHRFPKESHLTAAWANIDKVESASGVTTPSQISVEEAKEWVDSNQK